MAGATREILADVTHPYHLAVTRRMNNLDPNRLHWWVLSSKAVSTRRFLRMAVAKRVHYAFIRALNSVGLDEHGKLLDEKPVSSEPRSLRFTSERLSTDADAGVSATGRERLMKDSVKSPLTGSLLVRIPAQATVLRMTKAEADDAARTVLSEVLRSARSPRGR